MAVSVSKKFDVFVVSAVSESSSPLTTPCNIAGLAGGDESLRNRPSGWSCLRACGLDGSSNALIQLHVAAAASVASLIFYFWPVSEKP